MENIRADALSTLVVLLLVDLKKETYFEVLKTSSLEEPFVVQQVDEEPYWIDPLLKYLRSGELPPNHKEARKIRKQAARYVLYDDKLYKLLDSDHTVENKFQKILICIKKILIF